MNDKVSRIGLVLLGLALSALAVKAIVKDDDDRPRTDTSAVGTSDDSPGTAPGATGGSGDDAPFDPLQGSKPSAEPGGPGAARAEDVATPPALPRREVGPPLADGTPVDTTLRRRPGTVTRYRVTNAIAQRDRNTGASAGQRWAFDVTTRVASVAADGSARVRLEVDAIRIQALFSDGIHVDFDSRDPDEAALADPARAIVIKPLLAVVGVPVEFALAPNGGCMGIEGLDAWHEAWIEVVEDLNPGSSRKAVPPYTSDTVLHEWSEMLFPPILGGTLKAGEKRDVQILRDTLQSAYVEFRGPLRATHDDGDVFRVRLVTTPAKLPRQGPSRSPQEAAVAGVRVLADADAYDAAWRFRRSTGTLLDAEIDTEYQLHVSWNMGQDASGEDSYQRLFLDVERMTRVETLSE